MAIGPTSFFGYYWYESTTFTIVNIKRTLGYLHMISCP